MFGKCMWYQLKTTHNLNQIIYNFHILFGTDLYAAHLTAGYNVYSFKEYPINSFKKTGGIYRTCTDGFYALQQDYIMEGVTDKIFHVSLAYKVGHDFTEREMRFINSCTIDEYLDKKDIQLKLWDCNSKYPRDWKVLPKK